MSNLIMCEECLTVFDSDKMRGISSCPIHGCYGELFEIDELMIDIITNLRKKGYDTRYCFRCRAIAGFCAGKKRFLQWH